jgi:hypothetical protein
MCLNRSNFHSEHIRYFIQAQLFREPQHEHLALLRSQFRDRFPNRAQFFLRKQLPVGTRSSIFH